MTHSRPRNHKPRDLYACVERLHKDNTWRLVYTNTLYSDPLYNNKLNSVPDFDVRSDQVTRRDHHLMWLLTHIETEQNQEFIRTARLRRENSLSKPYPLEEGDAIILGPNPFLRTGLPKDIGDWHQGSKTLPWVIQDWYHITWTALLDERHFDTYKSLPQLTQWIGHTSYLLKTLPLITERPQCTFGTKGIPDQCLTFDEPFEAASSHDRLKGTLDWMNLLPNSPETTRLIVGVD